MERNQKLLKIIVAGIILSLSNFGEGRSLPKTVGLTKITENIKYLQSNLKSDYQKQNSVQQALNDNETTLSDLIAKEQITETQLNTEELILAKLKTTQRIYQQQLAIQEENLRQQTLATYLLGGQTYAKALFNAEDLTKLNRILVYFHYLQQARSQTISGLSQLIAKIEQNRQSIGGEQQKLVNLKNQQLGQKNKLQTFQIERKNLLEVIHHKIKTQKQKLAVLLVQKHKLEDIIAGLKTSVKTYDNNYLPEVGPWRKNLTWPAKGQVRDLFGTSIANSQLKWDGILIDAPKGQKVYAVAAGKVVFAEWLQGYGLLLIINHGHGYMSLYGRNEVLYKKVGDVVNGGELIANVGDSGGYDTSSLYFAIRYNGTPVNPQKWCTS